MGGAFSAWDWAVVFGYLAFTTWLGAKLSGKQQTIRDFFLGGRKLPWYAVSGSIIASEISGVTFVSVPAVAWATGGDYSYLMLAVGSILARIIIGYWFIPAYYENEIYSPYEFMGKRLGPTVDRVATAIFILGGFLAQGARLFLAGLVLDAITGFGIVPAVLVIAAISVVWTWYGGINSVVWTDVMQFAVLFIGAFVALAAAVSVVPGGWAGVADAGREAGKFRLWNFSLSPTAEFTFWCGLFGTTFLNLGALGTDQMMAQRLFCCRDPREARKAILASIVGVAIAGVMLTVGVAIFAYFKAFPMTPEQVSKVNDRSDYVFPLFILQAMPVGVKGLLFAAIFAAATATSTLAAMAQTGLASFYRPFVKKALDEASLIRVSRLFVVLAAAGLCVVAILCASMRQHKDILRLALNMAAYTYGTMLGMLLLALLPLRRDGRGLAVSVPLSLLVIFALNWQHQDWARWTVGIGVLALIAASCGFLGMQLLKLPLVIAGAALLACVAFWPLPSGNYLKLAFPWHFPIGCGVTLLWGALLGRPRPPASPAEAGA